jgi:phosphoribosylglycinamide formyltransferase 1
MTSRPQQQHTLRIGVLASGEGTTLQAIVDASARRSLQAEVVVVVSNNRESGALRRAQAAAIPALHLSARTHPDPDDLDSAMLRCLQSAQADLVVLAGFMKKIGPKTLDAFRDRIFNTHPALLPKYSGKGMYGRYVYEAVLAGGESETGVTIHRVDGEYDHGAVVAQVRVPIQQGDTPDTLAARVQAAERSFLVETLQHFALGVDTQARHCLARRQKPL